jgi:predicted SprT family Zn-dependent metalloprotease
MSLTVDTYTKLDAAYRHFNDEIFGGKLPECIITLVYARTARGYFRPRPFLERDAEAVAGDDEGPQGTVDEVALNPFFFVGRTDEEIFSTMVHEQVHLWQAHWGTPPKRPVHNKEWAAKMEEIGLMPSATGEPGGKRTGRRVTHYIIEGGAYQRAFATLPVAVDWNALLPKKPEKKKRPKQTYKCEPCEQSVRGNIDQHIVCGECGERME